MPDLTELLSAVRLVDLTQPLGPGTALRPGSRPFVAAPLRLLDGSGTPARAFAILEPDA